MKAFCRILCLLLILACLPAAAFAVTLEQVQPVMPEIDLYVHQNEHDLSGLDISDIQATLDGEPLTVEAFTPSKEGIYYVFMLDVSASIPEAHLQSVCSVIAGLADQLGPEDELALITFGDEVKVLLQGGEDASQVRQALSDIHAVDNNTCFYEAMSKLVETVSAKQGMRRVAVMVSDGVNDTAASMTQEELEATLREASVAVYAMAVENGAQSIDQYRSFITLTGGNLLPFTPDTAQETLDSLLFSTDRIWHLSLRGTSNIADGQPRQLEIQFGELSTLQLELKPTQWQIDAIPPSLLMSDADVAAKTVRLEFSEPMANASVLSCYLLHSPSGELFAPDSVEIDGLSATLHCSMLTEDPGWTLSIEGLTDASMEKNSLPAVTLALTRPVQEAPTAPKDEPTHAELEHQQSMTRIITGLCIAGAVLALIGVIAAILVISSRKKAKVRSASSGKTAANTTRVRNVTFVFADEAASPSDQK